jgi:hypothetical protein
MPQSLITSLLSLCDFNNELICSVLWMHSE